MLGFAAPEWLLLLPMLAFAGWYWSRPSLMAPLRLLAAGLLVLALAEPRISDRGDALDVWVLVDRSSSAAELLEPRLPEIESLLRRFRKGRDRLHFVEFAEEVRLRGEQDEEAFGGPRNGTRIATAISFALSSMPTGRASRMLLLTDGFSTEPLGELQERLKRESVPIDFRLVARNTDEDWSVRSLTLPSRAQLGEPYPIEIVIGGAPDGEVLFELSRNEETVTAGVARVEDGIARLRFSDRSTRPGALAYRVRLSGEDQVPGNDTATAWIEIGGGPRILLVTGYRDDPLAKVLRANGFEVEMVTRPRRLSVGQLSGAKAVIFNNLPANLLPGDFSKALDFYVRVQGGGLLMAGGRYSFGSGGYFESPLDPLLPVSMELRQDHRTLNVALAIVMDRSGSMAAGVASGFTKMDLANEGAARSISLLGPSDAVTVFAVDSQPHRVVRLTRVAEDREELTDAVRRITSSGGGIFVYRGLEAAWAELKEAPSGQRHVILFSDAADSEEPGDYRRLIEEMVANGTSVSVIGLGSDRDVDAPLLEDIARLGNGRIFFNADPASLPAVFAQETVAVARSAFIDEPTGVEPTAGWMEVASAPISGLESVDGYNLSYLREEATAGALSRDDYRAPLVAHWNRGAGRVAAVSFPLAGDASVRVRSWDGYGDFLQTLARWVMGDPQPPGIALRHRLDGKTLELELLYDESWEPRLAQSAPEVLLAEGEGGAIHRLIWERIEPGRFRTRRALADGGWYRGAVRVGSATLPFGPVEAPAGAEWSFDPGKLVELRELSRVSGGRERADLSGVWEDRPISGDWELRDLMLSLFLAVFLLEAFLTRIGFRVAELPSTITIRSPSFAWARDRWRRSKPHSANEPVVIETVDEPDEPDESDEPAGPDRPEPRATSERRKERFARAKRGR